MKKNLLVKAAMIAIAVFGTFSLGAIPGNIAVVGWATDQNNEGVESVEVVCVQSPSISTTTNNDGSYAMTIPYNTSIKALAPEGYSSSSTNDQESQRLTSSNNRVDFTFHNDSSE